MLSTKIYGRWACILGAAEGLGAAFSREAARRGFDVLMVDINQPALKDTASQISNEFGVRTMMIIEDLSQGKCVAAIMEKIKSHDCRFLIYNAAYGPVKPFLSNDTEELNRYLNVNIRSTLHIVHQFVALFPQKRSGILLLSSLAGFRGTRFVIPYAATKAFLWNLAEGLYYEFQHRPLDISVCIAGATDTPNFRATNPKHSLLMPKPMAPQKVAELTLKAYGKRLFIFPGLTNKATHFILNRILPRAWSSALHNLVMKKMYGE